jgi:outer membrane lipase/esterase
MKTPSLRLTAALALAGLLFSASLPAQQPRTFANQYSFGDSLSDNGNVFALSGGTNPPAPYVAGRFSNGLVFTEYLRAGLQPASTYTAPGRADLNFAFAGATAAPGGSVPALGQQIATFQARGVTPAANDLFTVLAGANDVLNAIGNPATQNLVAVGSAATGAATAVTSGVQTLFTAGAKNIVVINLPDIARTARFTTGSGAAASPLAQSGSAVFNSELRSRLGALTVPIDARLTLVDLGSLFTNLLRNADRWGFTVTNQEYVGLQQAGQNPGNASNYIFWDGIHPTSKTHAIMAQAITEALNPELVLGTTAPQGLALLAQARMTAGVVERRLDARRGTGTSAPNAWVDYSYQFGGRDADRYAPDFEYSSDTFSVGVDAAPTSHLTAGLAVSTERTKNRARVSSFQAKGATVTAYGAWTAGRWFVDANVGFGKHDLSDVFRRTAFGGMQTSAVSNGDHFGAGARFGRTFAFGAARVQPWTGLSYSRADVSGYRESGVPALNFAYDSTRADSTDGALGLNVDCPMSSDETGPLAVGFSIAFRDSLDNADRRLTGRLADTVATSASIMAQDGNGRTFDAGAYLTGVIGKRLNWTLGYSAENRQNGNDGHRFSLSFRAGF